MDRIMLYVALPVEQDNRVIGAVRAGISVSDIEQVLGEFYKQMLIAGLIIMLVAGIASWYLAHYWVRPIRTLRLGWSVSPRVISPRQFQINTQRDEYIGAGRNAMAKQMDARIQAIIHERNEKAAILKMEKLERMRKNLWPM